MQACTRGWFHCHCSSEGSPAVSWLDLRSLGPAALPGTCPVAQGASPWDRPCSLGPVGILGVNNQSCKNLFFLSENLKSLNSEQDNT